MTNDGDKELREFVHAKYQAKKVESLVHTADYSRILKGIRERNSGEGCSGTTDDPTAVPGCSKDETSSAKAVPGCSSSDSAFKKEGPTTPLTSTDTPCATSKHTDSKYLNSDAKGNLQATTLSDNEQPVNADTPPQTPTQTPPQTPPLAPPPSMNTPQTLPQQNPPSSKCDAIETSPMHRATAPPTSKTLQKAESVLRRCKVALQEAKTTDEGECETPVVEEKPSLLMEAQQVRPEDMSPHYTPQRTPSKSTQKQSPQVVSTFHDRCREAIADALTSLEERPCSSVILVEDTPEEMEQDRLVEENLNGLDGSLFDEVTSLICCLVIYVLFIFSINNNP